MNTLIDNPYAIDTVIDRNQSFPQFVVEAKELWLDALREKYNRDKERTLALKI